MRSSLNGPRSLTRTITDRPILQVVTGTREGSGSVRCAAVMSCMSKRSPFAVRRPWKPAAVPGGDTALHVADAAVAHESSGARRHRRRADCRAANVPPWGLSRRPAHRAAAHGTPVTVQRARPAPAAARDCSRPASRPGSPTRRGARTSERYSARGPGGSRGSRGSRCRRGIHGRVRPAWRVDRRRGLWRGRRQRRLDARTEFVHGERVHRAAVVAHDHGQVPETDEIRGSVGFTHAHQQGGKIVAERGIEHEPQPSQFA